MVAGVPQRYATDQYDTVRGRPILGVDLMEYISHIMNNFYEEPKDWITLVQAVERPHSLLIWIAI
ncbi:hypothetical protein Taro_017531 [Colocasia esculenta]|uniref:Uncharacterized protein n=1 Tax=Colocasia esculenta TaxID=4460 RepID=A0A843UNU5_COLES|nr:hypothetical protein [Colocasia esculenta]